MPNLLMPWNEIRRTSGYFLIVLMITFITTGVHAQEKVITAGFQFKPIFSSEFFNTGPVSGLTLPLADTSITLDTASVKISPQSGFCIGMVIRKGITKTVSIETGINYVKRNFKLDIQDDTTSESKSFSIIGYEIPIQGLIFIPLSDKIYMDVAMGFSFDFYPSDIFTQGLIHEHYGARKSWASFSLLGNLGWEYRTEKSGYFYFGASYHRPFNDIYTSLIAYPNSTPGYNQAKLLLQGNYLTVDLRYFFHSDPEKRKKKTKKPDRRQS